MSRRWLWIPALVALGCRCGAPTEEPERTVVFGHYAEWDRLVDAAAHGDLEIAREVASGLTGGAPAEAGPEAKQQGTSRIGAALGFLSFAEDEVELADAVVSAAGGCGSCHEAVGVPPPEAPPWTHETGARWVVDGLVWGRAGRPPRGGDDVREGLSEVWAAPIPRDTGPATPAEAEVRAARVLVACAACHGGDP